VLVLLLVVYSRGRIDLIKKASAVPAIENTRETPGVVLERLDIHDLDQQDIARLGRLDLKRSAKVVNLGEIDIAHIVGGIVVLDLPSCPVDTFNLDSFPVLDGTGGWDCELLSLRSLDIRY
jgi:hypothetical protein